MIEKEINGDIGILTLNDPPHNNLSGPEFIQFKELMEWIEGNNFKALIITGSGRHFSSGAKLDSVFTMAKAGDPMESMMDSGKEVLNYLEDLNIPVVAAIKGVCFGGGLEIALACHIRFCSETALFAFPESNNVLMPGLGGTYRLGERLLLKDSLKIVLGGDMIDAKEALLLKIVDTIVNNEDTLEFSLHFLRKITEDRPLKLINYVMQSLKNSKRLGIEESMKEETRMFCDLARIESIRRK